MKKYETLAILKQHIESAVQLIHNLKQKNSKLHVENSMLKKENEQCKSELQRYTAQIQNFEGKMRDLERLVDEAQNEQSELEQSILTAISSLGKVDSYNEDDEDDFEESFDAEDLDIDDEGNDISINLNNSPQISTGVDLDQTETANTTQKEDIGIF